MADQVIKMEAELLDEKSTSKNADEKLRIGQQIASCDETIKVFREKLDYLQKRKVMLSRPQEEKAARERAQAK